MLFAAMVVMLCTAAESPAAQAIYRKYGFGAPRS